MKECHYLNGIYYSQEQKREEQNEIYTCDYCNTRVSLTVEKDGLNEYRIIIKEID